jgi:hypothetical protein
MVPGYDGDHYQTLADIADRIFGRCNDDPSCIAKEIRKLDPDIRNDLLSSDLLNAWQVFWYYFRDYPGDEAVEFMNFHSAGELAKGVPMGGIDIFTLTFQVTGDSPEIALSDDLQEVARFRGSDAWMKARAYIEEA